MKNETLEILFKDDYLIAINKPSGLLVHRSAIDRHETRFAMQILREQLAGQHVYPLHRLDKPTSGVLLFALDTDIARDMSQQFSDNQVKKTYLAVVRGYTEEQGLIDYPLKEEHDKMTDARARQDKPAQPAITAYTRLATIELPYPVGRYQSSRYSLIMVEPQTGRRHQIRRHMKHIFHPVVGDTTHGDGAQNRLFREQLDCQRLLLHAHSLTVTHPLSGAALCIAAPLDEVFTRIAAMFGYVDSDTPEK